MSANLHRITLLEIPIVEERYGRCFLASIGIHLGLVAFLLLSPYLLPRLSPVQIGTGPGGGSGGSSYSVGVADDLGGGAGMTKPSLVPQPPALPAEKATKEEKAAAIPLPDALPIKKLSKAQEKSTASKKGVPASQSNLIPTAPQPGAGGTGGLSGGSGGGVGGGVGVSIGSGSGGFSDSWYARTVEARLSSNWIRPAPGIRMEAVYSFYISASGNIYDIKQEKSSGNTALDLTAERAIRASNPLSPPPPEFQGRPIQFVAQFIYPPTP